MKTKICILLYILCPIINWAQKNSRLTDSLSAKIDTITETNGTYVLTQLGTHVYNYKFFFKGTNTVSGEYTVVDGKRNGADTRYYLSGKVQSINTYSLGVPVGVFITYYENGNIESYYDYGYSDKDKLLEEFELTVYHTDTFPPYASTSSTERYYKKLQGQRYFFYSNGNTKRIESYKDNKPDGVWQYFYDNGKLEKKVI